MSFDILLIDDDEELCEELKYILENQNYCVDLAYSAQSGITKIRSGSYKLILLDIRMPGASGKEVLNFISSNYLDFKIIILTGSPVNNTEPQISEAEDHFNGADCVMRKPFDIEQLLLKIEELTKT